MQGRHHPRHFKGLNALGLELMEGAVLCLDCSKQSNEPQERERRCQMASSKMVKIAGARYQVPLENAHAQCPEPYIDVRIAVWGARLNGWELTGWEKLYPFDLRQKRRLVEAFPWIAWDFERATCLRPSSRGKNHRYVVPGEFRDYDGFFMIYVYPGPNCARSSIRVFGAESKKIFGTQDCALWRAPEIYDEVRSKISHILRMKHRKLNREVDHE